MVPLVIFGNLDSTFTLCLVDTVVVGTEWSVMDAPPVAVSDVGLTIITLAMVSASVAT